MSPFVSPFMSPRPVKTSTRRASPLATSAWRTLMDWAAAASRGCSCTGSRRAARGTSAGLPMPCCWRPRWRQQWGLLPDS
eukprot:8366318-Lingulodinium_polyedra.AAC.1